MSLTLEQKQVLVYLHAIDGVGSGSLTRFIQDEKSRQKLLKKTTLSTNVGKIIKTKKSYQSYEKLKKEHTIDSYWQWLKEQRIKLVFLGDKHYPMLLAQTARPPIILYLKYQDPDALKLLLARLPLAVVGTRRITAYGKFVTQKITQELVEFGAVIVSGFMYGVDVTAHQQAIKFGGGSIAVLGFGLLQMYPLRQKKLADWFLAKGGLFVSQFSPLTTARPGNFPARNAVVAGLSLGVVVTEAARRSGSHITAQLALDEGRAVMAVPGPIDNPFSEGTKWLINQGASLVTSGTDVLDQVGFEINKNQSANPASNTNPKIFKFRSQTEKQIYELLLVKKLTADELAQRLNLDVISLSGLLTNLELDGLVAREGVRWQGVRRI